MQPINKTDQYFTFLDSNIIINTQPTMESGLETIKIIHHESESKNETVDTFQSFNLGMHGLIILRPHCQVRINNKHYLVWLDHFAGKIKLWRVDQNNDRNLCFELIEVNLPENMTSELRSKIESRKILDKSMFLATY